MKKNGFLLTSKTYNPKINIYHKVDEKMLWGALINK